VREGVEALAPMVQDGRVAGASVRTSDGGSEDIRAGFVIVAGGASDRFAARAGLPRDRRAPMAVAARAYYRADGPVPPVFEACIGIADGDRWLPGYGWIFPAGRGEANVGAFVIRSGSPADGDVSARH